MVVLSPAGTKLMQQNGRFHWEFGCVRRRDLNTAWRWLLPLSCWSLNCLVCAHTCIHYTHLHFDSYTYLALSMWLDLQPYNLHFLMLLSVKYACMHTPNKQTNLAALSHSIYTYGTAALFSLCVLHTQNGRQFRDALSQRDAQQNENGKEYCRQKNNGAEGRVEPGGEALCSGSRIME